MEKDRGKNNERQKPLKIKDFWMGKDKYEIGNCRTTECGKKYIV